MEQAFNVIISSSTKIMARGEITPGKLPTNISIIWNDDITCILEPNINST